MSGATALAGRRMLAASRPKGKRRMVSTPAMLATLRRAHGDLRGEKFTFQAYDDWALAQGAPRAQAVRARLGSWNKAVVAAGLDLHAPEAKRFTRAEVVAAIQAAAAQYPDEVLSWRSYSAWRAKRPGLPAFKPDIVGLFGSWAAACEAAGATAGQFGTRRPRFWTDKEYARYIGWFTGACEHLGVAPTDALYEQVVRRQGWPSRRAVDRYVKRTYGEPMSFAELDIPDQAPPLAALLAVEEALGEQEPPRRYRVSYDAQVGSDGIEDLYVEDVVADEAPTVSTHASLDEAVLALCGGHRLMAETMRWFLADMGLGDKTDPSHPLALPAARAAGRYARRFFGPFLGPGDRWEQSASREKARVLASEAFTSRGCLRETEELSELCDRLYGEDRGDLIRVAFNAWPWR